MGISGLGSTGRHTGCYAEWPYLSGAIWSDLLVNQYCKLGGDDFDNKVVRYIYEEKSTAEDQSRCCCDNSVSVRLKTFQKLVLLDTVDHSTVILLSLLLVYLYHMFV